MTSTTAQIRQAFADTLAATFTDWQVFPYLKASPTPPAIDVTPGPTIYDTAMHRGNDHVEYIVRAVVSLGTDVSGQQKLDPLLDLDLTATGSMKNALETHDATDGSNRNTLGGCVSDLRVTEVSEPKMFGTADGSGGLLGYEFTVEVIP